MSEKVSEEGLPGGEQDIIWRKGWETSVERKIRPNTWVWLVYLWWPTLAAPTSIKLRKMNLWWVAHLWWESWYATHHRQHQPTCKKYNVSKSYSSGKTIQRHSSLEALPQNESDASNLTKRIKWCERCLRQLWHISILDIAVIYISLCKMTSQLKTAGSDISKPIVSNADFTLCD